MKSAKTGCVSDRHVAEEVVEHVRLDDVVELFARPQPVGDREAAVGEMVEERRGGNETGHGDDFPAGELAQLFADRAEIRDLVEQAKRGDAVEIGMMRQLLRQLRLAVAQRAPHRLFVGAVVVTLRHGEIGTADRIVAAQALRRAFARIVGNTHRHGCSPRKS